MWSFARSRGWGHRTLATITLGALAASCSASGLSYVSHGDAAGESIYYAIPSGWQRFTVQQVFRSADPRASSATLRQVEQSLWGNIIVGKHVAGLSAVSNGFSEGFPFGIVKAQALTSAEQDSFSLATLRTLILQQDPFNPSSSIDHFSVKAYQTFVRKGGFRGSEMTVEERVGTSSPIELEQIAEVNPSTTWAYVLGVGCDVACFARNAGVIDSIIRSFGVEATP